MWVITVVYLTGLLYQCDANTVKSIKWSKSYTLKAVLTAPTANLTIPYQVWYNGNTYKSRVDFYGGLDKLYRQWNALNKTFDYYKIRPDFVNHKEACNILPSKTAETQTYVLNSYLPIKPWTYVRPETKNNVETHKFIYEYSKSIKDNIIANIIFRVWVTLKKDGTAVPVRFVYEVKRGNSLLDKFSHDYSYFDDIDPDVQTLQMPLGMKCIPLGNAYLDDSIDLLSKFIDPTINDVTKTIDKTKDVINYRKSKKSFQWSANTYSLKAILTVPNADIIEPYQVWFDGDSRKAIVDFYNGMETLYREYDKKTGTYKYYKVRPTMNVNMKREKVCSQIDCTDSEVANYDFNSYLPDLPWEFDKIETKDGVITEKYVYIQPVYVNKEKIGDYTNIFTIWIHRDRSTELIIPKRFDYELREGFNRRDNEYRVLDHFFHSYTYFNYTIPQNASIHKPTDMTCNLDTLKSDDEPIDPLMEYIVPNLEHTRIKKTFDKFRIKHNKIYIDEDEHLIRMNNYKKNLRYINSHNRQHKAFTLSVNHLADLSSEEMKVFLGTISKNDTRNVIEKGSGDDEDDDINNIEGVNANFDWRDYGAVSSVKDQTSMCAGCYAFTAAAAIESSAYVARGCKDLEELSEQAIIDCSWGSRQNGNFGCAGGTYEYALRWAEQSGIPLKSQYGPYLGMEGQCKLSEMTKLVKISSSYKVNKKKRVIKDTLRVNGPLLAAMDTNHQSFLFYSSGVYEELLCSNDPNDRSHGVTIVGYGRELGEEYWTIKNSFGANWGEKGFMRINMMRNLCGLRNDVYAVEFKTNKYANCKPLSKYSMLSSSNNLFTIFS